MSCWHWRAPDSPSQSRKGALQLLLDHPPGYRSRNDDDRALCPDPLLGFRSSPNFTGRLTRPDFDVAVVTDAVGHRIGPAPEQDKGGLRILAAGNSITFGWGVDAEQAWPAVLQVELGSRSSRGVVVTNAGVSGYNLDQVAQLIIQEAGREPLDGVVLGLYAGGVDRLNDPYVMVNGCMVQASAAARSRPFADGLLTSPMRQPAARTLDLWLAEHFYLAALTGRALFGAWSGIVSLGARRSGGAAQGGVSTTESDDTLAAIAARVSTLGAELRSGGIGFAVVLIVTQEPGGRFATRQRDLVERLQSTLTADGILTLNSLPELERWLVDNETYRFEHDGHWNAAAHAVVGRMLANNLSNAAADGSWLDVDVRLAAPIADHLPPPGDR